MSRDCPVCGGNYAQSLREVRYVLPDDSPLPRVTRIRRCDTCGFVYADSAAAAADYLRHYQVNSIYAATDIRAGGGQDRGDQERLEKAATRIAPRLGAGDLFIDIGAGGGGLLRAVAAQAGCRTLGIDPDQRCVEALKAAGLDALTGTLDQLPREYEGKAQSVALSHVLEHLWQPRKDLKAALKLLAPGGVLYAETPDAARYADFPNAPFYYFDPEHINHFSVQGLARLAREAGGGFLDGGQNEISLADGTRYPVCWALISAQPAAVGANDAAGPDVQRYIAQQAAAMKNWKQRVTEMLAAVSGPFIVWGTGSQTQRVLADDFFDTGRVLAFADSDRAKQSRTLLGKSIMAPADALAKHPSAPVVILAAKSAAAAIGKILAAQWPDRTAIRLPAE